MKRSPRIVKAIGISLSLLTAVPAWAKIVDVKVEARTMPWDLRLNRAMRYGGEIDGILPKQILIPELKAGRKITLRASGSASYWPGGRSFGPDGDPEAIGARGRLGRLPGNFASSGNAIAIMALMGSFFNADGTIAGRPFAVSSFTEVIVPEGAVGMQFGFNDEMWRDNRGIMSVKIDIPVGSVTVEPSEGATAGASSSTGTTGAASAQTPTATAPHQVVVNVDSAAAPWDASLNAGVMPLGNVGAKPPVIVPIEVPSGKVAIVADGTTSTTEAKDIPSTGIKGKLANDTTAPNGQRYPSFYMPKLMYPVNRHALIAVFVDDKGNIVSRPFPVGEGVRLNIPDTAAGLALGFNDADFTGNTGTLKVMVQLP